MKKKGRKTKKIFRAISLLLEIRSFAELKLVFFSTINFSRAKLKWGSTEMIELPKKTIGLKNLLVHIHLFHLEYLEMLKEFTEQSAWDSESHLVITSPHKIGADWLDYLETKFSGVEFLLVPNVGRNFAPLVVEVLPKARNFDYLLHLHSKRSPQIGSEGVEWGRQSWNLLLHPARLGGIISLLAERKEIGIVAPDVSRFVSAAGYSWLGSEDKYKKLRMKTDTLGIHAPFFFPAGGMFLANADILTEGLAGLFGYSDFPEEKAQLDGELHHGLERLVGALCIREGKKAGVIFSDSEIVIHDGRYLRSRTL